MSKVSEYLSKFPEEVPVRPRPKTPEPKWRKDRLYLNKARLVFYTEADLRDQFMAACYANERTMTDVLQRYLKDYCDAQERLLQTPGASGGDQSEPG